MRRTADAHDVPENATDAGTGNNAMWPADANDAADGGYGADDDGHDG